MAYEFKRQKRIVKDIKMGEQVIHVDLVLDNILKEFNRCRNDIIRAQIEVDKASKVNADPENFEQITGALGSSIIALMNLVFGETNAKLIMDFYENNMLEMINMVVPFIEDEIAPEIKNLVSENTSQIRERSLNRAARRHNK